MWSIFVLLFSVIFTLSPLLVCCGDDKAEMDQVNQYDIGVNEQVSVMAGFDPEISHHNEINSPSHLTVKSGESNHGSDEHELHEHENFDDHKKTNAMDKPSNVHKENNLPQKEEETTEPGVVDVDVTSSGKVGNDLDTDSSPASDGENNDNTEVGNRDDNADAAVSETSQNVDVQNGDTGKEATVTVSTKKQRYFPLLYTFGSLFTSFLTEFGEVPSSADTNAGNSSDTIAKNVTEGDGLAQYLNVSSNSTDQGKRTRFQCSLHLKNTTEDMNETAEVKIINSTELLEILNFSKNQKTSASPCVLVMFYTKWCHFSAKTAPEYNALARAFPQLDVLAVDTSHFSYLNAKFGTVAVPNIMLFHSRSAVRFNHTTRDLDHFIQFVNNNTGLDASSSVAVLPEDYKGPLSNQVEQGRDWLLWLAWSFILVCSTYGFFFSLYGQAVIARLRVLWQEHQHIE